MLTSTGKSLFDAVPIVGGRIETELVENGLENGGGPFVVLDLKGEAPCSEGNYSASGSIFLEGLALISAER